MGFLNKNFPRVHATVNTMYRALRLYHSNGSFRALGVFFLHLYRNMLDGSAPQFVTIALTYRCPCRCVHCCVSASERHKQSELETWQVKSVIDQAKRLGVLQITFTGGEPLLREDIAELVRYAHDAGLLTRINTSGILLDRRRASELAKAGLTQCAISVDDADPDTHDRLRGVPGLHEKALRGIRNSQESGVLCQINTYASRRNVTEGLEKIIALGRRLGVLAVYIIPPTAIGRWDEAFDQALNEEEKARVRALQELTFVHLELATPLTMCGVCQKGILFVSPRGNITPCPFVPYVMGNIRDHTLSEVWHVHCAELSLVWRGGCPMNDLQGREALARHAEMVRTLCRSGS